MSTACQRGRILRLRRPALGVGLTVLLGVAGCAAAPSKEQVATFGAATTSLASIYQQAGDTDVELIQATSVEVAARNYISGAPIDLPAPRIVKPPKAFAERMAFTNALVKYTEALSQATDPAVLTKIEASAAGLVAAEKQFAVASGLPAAAGANAALDLTSTIGVAIVKSQTAEAIREVVEAAQPSVVLGTGLLINDVEADKNRLAADYAKWRRERLKTLAVMQERGGSPSELRDFYIASDQAARTYESRIKVLDAIGTKLALLIDAHRALLSNEPDIDATLATIQTVVQQIKALEEA